MSVVQFLETLGAAPSALSAANYAHAVEALGLEDATRDALMARDVEQINRAVGGRSQMCCAVFVPD